MYGVSGYIRSTALPLLSIPVSLCRAEHHSFFQRYIYPAHILSVVRGAVAAASAVNSRIWTRPVETREGFGTRTHGGPTVHGRYRSSIFAFFILNAYVPQRPNRRVVAAVLTLVQPRVGILHVFVCAAHNFRPQQLQLGFSSTSAV